MKNGKPDPEWLVELEQTDPEIAAIIRRSRGGAAEKGLNMTKGCRGNSRNIRHENGTWVPEPKTPCSGPPSWYYVPSNSPDTMLCCEEHVPKNDDGVDPEWDLIEGSIWGDPMDFPGELDEEVM